MRATSTFFAEAPGVRCGDAGIFLGEHLCVGSAKELMVSLIVRQRAASGFFQLYRSNRSKFYFELLVFSIHVDILGFCQPWDAKPRGGPFRGLPCSSCNVGQLCASEWKPRR